MVLSDTFSIECFENFDQLFDLEFTRLQMVFLSEQNQTAKRFYDFVRSQRGQKIQFVDLEQSFDQDTILKLYLVMVLKLGSERVTLSRPNPGEWFMVYQG